MKHCAICTGINYKKLEGGTHSVSLRQVYTCDSCARPFRYLGIYNPRDIWHSPYFDITDTEVLRNDKGKYACALSENDYLQLCKNYGHEPYKL